LTWCPRPPPMPLSARDLAAFTDAGLTETELAIHPPGPGQKHTVSTVDTRRAG
jgi:hypothetical protein